MLSQFFYYASGTTTVAAMVLSIRLIAEERVGVYARFVGYCKEHFGDDEKGRGEHAARRARRLMVYHLLEAQNVRNPVSMRNVWSIK